MTPKHRLPTLALSVRQPWAWAIIHAGKDVENRTRQAVSHMRPLLQMPGPCRIAIHAAKGMTQTEYHDFRDDYGLPDCPRPDDLLRGGIIGSVEVVGTVGPHSHCASEWWMGGYGLLLRDPDACAFVPATGALGLFTWSQCGEAVPPAKWMREYGRPVPSTLTEPQPELF